jgi:hypothetical protein
MTPADPQAAEEPASDSVEFELNPSLPLAALARRFTACGRLQIADFLVPEAASGLRTHLERSERWRHLFNLDERCVEIPSADWDSTPDPQRTKVLEVIDEAAAYDFQYQYDTIRVSDRVNERTAADSLLDRFAQFLSSPPALDLFMRITGSDDLAFADCQATRYRSGDFLTPHNDELDGMHRRFAYVLNLTSDWLPRWGGLLHFVDSSAGIEETITPRFNALSLFAIGQSHYVSQVATYAPVPRISVTGWLRTQVPA